MTARSQHQLEVSQNLSVYDAISLDSLGTHMFYGEVCEESVYAATNFIIKSNLLLTDLSHITMMVNTIGGSVHDGLGLIDMMNTSSIPIHTVGVGSVISMGVLLLSAGTKGHRYITENSVIMAHQFYGGFEGKFHELVAHHKSTEYLQDQFIRHYEIHTSMDRRKIKNMLFGKTDTYLTPQQCIEYGIADKIISHYPPVYEESKAKPKKRGVKIQVQEDSASD